MLFIVLITVLGACTTTESVGTNQSQSKMPNIKGSKEISLPSSDLEAIKVDFFGYDSTLFQNSLVVKVSSKTEAEIFPELEKELVKQGWRLDSDYMYSVWRNGDLYTFYYFIDQMYTDEINNLYRKYGIDGLEEGQTLILEYQIDSTASLPNPTQTAEAVAIADAQAQQALEATNSAIEASVNATQIAVQAEAQITQQAAEAEAQATQQAVEAEVQATQMAIQKEQDKINAQATMVARQVVFDTWNTEFFQEDGLPANMSFAREDPSRWDLTSKLGWLHLTGRLENPIKNVLLIPLTGTNVSIITRIDGNFTKDEQKAWIGLSPNDYYTNGYSVRLGLSLESKTGRTAILNYCNRDNCSSGDTNKAADSIKFSGPVYFRLDIQGDHFTAYYGEDGESWTYLGEISGISGGRNIILGSNDDYYWSRDGEFDSYFDFLHFKAIEPLDE